MCVCVFFFGGGGMNCLEKIWALPPDTAVASFSLGNASDLPIQHVLLLWIILCCQKICYIDNTVTYTHTFHDNKKLIKLVTHTNIHVLELESKVQFRIKLKLDLLVYISNLNHTISVTISIESVFFR